VNNAPDVSVERARFWEAVERQELLEAREPLEVAYRLGHSNPSFLWMSTPISLTGSGPRKQSQFCISLRRTVVGEAMSL
jgi:hypothetical protein